MSGRKYYNKHGKGKSAAPAASSGAPGAPGGDGNGKPVKRDYTLAESITHYKEKLVKRLVAELTPYLGNPDAVGYGASVASRVDYLMGRAPGQTQNYLQLMIDSHSTDPADLEALIRNDIFS